MSKNNRRATIAKTAIIRQRGQITIPDTIRQSASWITEHQPVVVFLADENELHIRPVQQATDWQALQREIGRVRALPGRPIDTTKFIADDRQRH